jgi:flagellar hook-length control protein FliK
MPLATVAATPAPTMAPTQDQGQVFQRMLNAAPGAGELKNQNGPAAAVTAGDDSLHAVPTAIAKNDKISDQPQGSQSPSIVIDATLTSKKEESQKDLSQAGSGESARALELAPAGNGRLPAEFLAASEPSHRAPTDAAAIAPKAVVMPDAAPSSIAPRETIHLQLGPSDLGRLTLQVSVQSQQVQATVGVEHRGLGEFLAASQGVLDDAMRQHGLRLEGLRIESITNSDVLGAGADRPGLLDHGQARQDTSRFERAPLARQVPQSEALSMKDHTLESGSRYRINLFA